MSSSKQRNHDPEVVRHGTVCMPLQPPKFSFFDVSNVLKGHESSLLRNILSGLNSVI